tara:strand:- start:164 stop:415 length:252 start_codon:yes stop_codon:yes gene_type:complete
LVSLLLGLHGVDGALYRLCFEGKLLKMPLSLPAEHPPHNARVLARCMHLGTVIVDKPQSRKISVMALGHVVKDFSPELVGQSR